jgi:DNA-directed RNA polymerase subunit M/transcription elongation factor TFIIS
MRPTLVPISLENMLLSLKKGETPVLNRDQAASLLSLKFSNDEPVLTMEDRGFVYEIVNLLMTVGYEDTYNFLKMNWEEKFGLSPNTRNMIIFENPLFETLKIKFINDTNFYKNKIEVSAGEKCKKCGSIETISAERQCRSGDEAVSIRVTCLQCTHHWMAQ